MLSVNFSNEDLAISFLQENPENPKTAKRDIYVDFARYSNSQFSKTTELSSFINVSNKKIRVGEGFSIEKSLILLLTSET